MNKADFLAQLRLRLNGLPEEDIAERLLFYSEMIDDRMEEGLSEDEAVTAIGPVDVVAAQTIADSSLAKPGNEQAVPKRQQSTLGIVLLVLSSPIWLALLISFFAVVIALFAVLWSVVAVLWAVDIALLACSVAGIFGCFSLCSRGRILQGLAFGCAAPVLFGLFIYGIYFSKEATKAIAKLSVKLLSGLKRLFVKKRKEAEAQ